VKTEIKSKIKKNARGVKKARMSKAPCQTGHPEKKSWGKEKLDNQGPPGKWTTGGKSFWEKRRIQRQAKRGEGGPQQTAPWKNLE